MGKLVVGVVLAGVLAAGGALYLHPPWRDRAVAQGTQWMDELLGIKTKEAVRRQKAVDVRRKVDKAVPVKRVPTAAAPVAPAPVASVPAPAPVASAPVPAPAPAAPAYVNRDPYPTTVEKVPQKDRQRLEDLIAQRMTRTDSKPGKARAD